MFPIKKLNLQKAPWIFSAICKTTLCLFFMKFVGNLQIINLAVVAPGQIDMTGRSVTRDIFSRFHWQVKKKETAILSPFCT